MQTMKKEAAHGFTQFELTTEIITKLNTFKLTPTAKLVLLYLTTCYNPEHAEVFPKQKTIADKLGVSERSVTRAIQELFNEGLILIECKYTNRYKLTSRIAEKCLDNLSDCIRQNVTKETDNLSPTCHEQTIEHDKQQTCKGGNVYRSSEQSARAERSHVYRERSQDDILADYAAKHNAKNINAYISKLKETGSANKIICEYKKKNYSIQRIKETQLQIQKYKDEAKTAVAPPESWKALGKKFGFKK